MIALPPLSAGGAHFTVICPTVGPPTTVLSFGAWGASHGEVTAAVDGPVPTPFTAATRKSQLVTPLHASTALTFFGSAWGAPNAPASALVSTW